MVKLRKTRVNLKNWLFSLLSVCNFCNSVRLRPLLFPNVTARQPPLLFITRNSDFPQSNGIFFSFTLFLSHPCVRKKTDAFASVKSIPLCTFVYASKWKAQRKISALFDRIQQRLWRCRVLSRLCLRPRHYPSDRAVTSARKSPSHTLPLSQSTAHSLLSRTFCENFAILRFFLS